MRIAFLNSSLELGKDGVGDYTRHLAAECAQNGHACCIIALHDRHVLQPSESKLQTETGSTIPLMRLPATLPWVQRARLAKAFLERFQPEWVSLQFVPYGFQDRGIIGGVTPHLFEVIGNTPLQIMFHETWIAPHLGASLKEKLVGSIQRHCVLKMVNKLRPKVFHTSNSAYVALLARNGVQASLLPLFGHMPVTVDSDASWLWQELANGGLEITPENRDKFWLFGFFGSLHPIWPAEPLFSHLKEPGVAARRKIVLLAVGRMGGGEALWESLASQYSPHFTFRKLGERSPEQVSQFLQSIDFGIATSPWNIIGKSGTVAAMLENGLPVIVNRDDIQFPFPVSQEGQSPLLHKMDIHLGSRLLELRRSKPCSTRSRIATEFLNSLEQAGGKR